MSASEGWPLQVAVHARLVAALAGLGPGGADVPVYDHVPEDPLRVHCRIDGLTIAARPIKGAHTRHGFSVHVFDRPTAQAAVTRGLKSARAVEAAVIAALDGWDPSVTGASPIQFESSTGGEADGALSQARVSRFSVFIGGS